MELNCDFEDYPGGYGYTCYLNSLEIKEPGTKIKSICGDHHSGKTNDDVNCLLFDSTVNFIPANLSEFFPNLKILNICNCSLKSICSEDLRGFQDLEVLLLDGNNLTTLPDDLFENTPKLNNISLKSNKIEFMSSKLFSPIITNDFFYIGLKNNTRIDEVFFTKFEESVPSLDVLMNIIDSQCLKP